MRKHASMFSYPSRGCFCKQPTTRVLLRISRFSRSRMLFVRILRQCWLGNSRYVSVSPILLDFAVHLLVQVAHRRGACAGAPQELGDVLHATHGYACQVHLDERLLHGRFPAPLALYDGCLDSVTDERFQVVLEASFVDFDYISFHRMVFFCV